MAMGNSLRLVVGAASLVVVASAMEAAEFGSFATAVASVAPLAAFSGWGADRLIVRNVSRDPATFRGSLGTALVFLAISAPCLVIVAVSCIPLVAGSWVSYLLVMLVAVSDIGFASLNGICAATFQARSHAAGTAWLNIEFSAARLLAAGLWLLSTDDHTATSWAWFYCAGSAVAGSASVVQVIRRLGRPSYEIRWSEWKDGFHFSLQMASFVGFRQIDRPVIGHLGGLPAVGIYSAAFRLADAAAMPVQSIMYATYGKFFEVGAAGPHQSLRFALRLLPIAAGAGLCSGTVIAALAPFAPQLLGPSYAGTEDVLLLLSGLPLLYAFYYVGADVLVASDHVFARTAIQLAMPLVSITMCFLLVPPYHAVGAALGALATHIVLAISAWSAVLYIARKH